MGKVRNIIESKGNAVFSVPSGITVFNALQLMSEKGIGALLIVDDSEIKGIFTERDYARKLILKGKSSKETPIRDVMTPNPTTVTMEASIEDCMVLMSDKKFRHLPVVENDKLVGVISIGDVVKFVIEEQKFIIKSLEQYITH